MVLIIILGVGILIALGLSVSFDGLHERASDMIVHHYFDNKTLHEESSSCRCNPKFDSNLKIWFHEFKDQPAGQRSGE